MSNDEQDTAGPAAGTASGDDAGDPAESAYRAATQPLRGPAPDADGHRGTHDGAAEDAPVIDARLWSAHGRPGGRAGLDGKAEPDGQAEQDGGAEPYDEGADQPAGKDQLKKKGSFWRELPLLLVIALVIALVVKTFVVQMFWIPTGSMQNTIEIGDRVMVNKLVYHFRSIQPGDIVVFNDDGSWNPEPPQGAPSSNPVVHAYDATVVRLYHAFVGMFDGAAQDNGNILIKRVIGVPGDRVACCDANGDMTINGVPLSESSYLYPGNDPGSAPSPQSGHFSITVPAGHLWVMGDHRAISDDSRLHTQDPFGGTIPESAVVGRAFVIIWPPSRWGFLPIPSTFNQPGVAGGKAAAASAQAASYLPLGAGFAGAIPLTWAQRRVRHWMRRRAQRGPRRR